MKCQKFFGDNLPEVDSPLFCENLLHLSFIFVFFLCGMMAAIPLKMIAHDLCKCMEKEFQWCLVLQFFPFRYIVDGFLDMIGDVMGIFRSFEYEIIFVSDGIQDDVTLIEKRIEE